MIYTGYEMLWLFFTCSFMGWLLEVLQAAAKQKRFINRGLVNGPFCVIYGIAAVLNTLVLQELTLFWTFVGAALLAAFIEWTAGHILEKMYHRKWWDYSNVKWNLDGYICLPASLLWGLLGCVMVKWGNNLLLRLFHLIPSMIGKIVLWIFLIVIVVDVAATLIILSGKSRQIQQWKRVDRWLTSVSVKLEDRLYTWMDMRIRTAYPKMEEVVFGPKSECFAAGCSFYKIALLFFIGAFLGDIVETIFCRITAGVWMSRSSVVWGPFSIVWGFAIAGATALLYRYRNRSDRFLFAMGTVLGGGYEYFCSVISEIVFGQVFWDYSEIPFNLGGRINLLYCFFWGFAAVIWFKGFYPVVSGWIEKIPKKPGVIATWCLIVFMCCNMAVSAMALLRSNKRREGVPAENAVQEMLDERFDDERLAKVYPNAIVVE